MAPRKRRTTNNSAGSTKRSKRAAADSQGHHQPPPQDMSPEASSTGMGDSPHVPITPVLLTTPEVTQSGQAITSQLNPLVPVVSQAAGVRFPRVAGHSETGSTPTPVPVPNITYHAQISSEQVPGLPQPVLQTTDIQQGTQGSFAPVSYTTPDIAPGSMLPQSKVKQFGAPLGRFVPLATKEKIWRGEYIELGSLLAVDDPESHQHATMSLVTINQQLYFKPTTQKAKPIFNIDKWTSAFFIFISIYLQKHPLKAIEMIKYADLIRKLAHRFGGYGWVNYDKEFRLEQALNPTRSWATYDSDLFLEKLAMPAFSNQPFRGSLGKAV